MSTQLISILALVDAYAPEKASSPARTHLAVAINRALAAPTPAEPAAPVLLEAWHLIRPDGHVAAREATCVKAWARINGYKPTIESLLAYEQMGWRVEAAAPAPKPAAGEPDYKALYEELAHSIAYEHNAEMDRLGISDPVECAALAAPAEPASAPEGAKPVKGWSALDLHAAQGYEDAQRFGRLPEPLSVSSPSAEQVSLSALWELQARVGDAHENHGRNDERTMKAREEFYEALRAALAPTAPALQESKAVTDAMVNAYLKAQAATVQAIDNQWGRGGKAPEYMHPVRAACKAGLEAALAASGKEAGE